MILPGLHQLNLGALPQSGPIFSCSTTGYEKAEKKRQPMAIEIRENDFQNPWIVVISPRKTQEIYSSCFSNPT